VAHAAPSAGTFRGLLGRQRVMIPSTSKAAPVRRVSGSCDGCQTALVRPRRDGVFSLLALSTLVWMRAEHDAMHLCRE
jgi:hypothetical protein